MKKILFLLTLLTSTVALQAESDWRWSITLGTGAIDFESDEIYTDADGSDGGTGSASDTYNPGIYGFGLTNGTHSFGYKITSAGSSEYSVSGTLPPGGSPSPFTNTVRERDYEETTLSYQYKLSDSWSLGLAYNDREHNVTKTESRIVPWDPVPGIPLEPGETADYSQSRLLNSTANIDGLALYATWVKQMSNVWYFSAKFGFAETNYERPITVTTTYNDMPNWWNQYFIDYFGGAINGNGFTDMAMEEGDSSTAIVGFSFVRVFPEAPNHQLIINYDTRSDDLASGTQYTGYAGTGYWDPSNSDTDNSLAGEGLGSTVSEETNWKLTAEWKYTF